MLTLTLILVLALLCVACSMADLTSAKPREFLADYPTLDQRLPLKAATTVFSGMYLEWTAGAIDRLSGAGVFAGIAMEDAVGGAADGDVTVLVRSMGGLRVGLGGGDVAAITLVGVAATVPEATDTDTVRVETAAAVTGTAIGKFTRMHTAGAGGLMDIGFKGAHLP